MALKNPRHLRQNRTKSYFVINGKIALPLKYGQEVALLISLGTIPVPAIFCSRLARH